MRLKPLQRCREWIISGAWVMWTNRLLTPRFTVAWRVAKANAFDVLTKSTFRPHADSILLPRRKIMQKSLFHELHFLLCEVNQRSLLPAKALLVHKFKCHDTISWKTFFFGTYFGVSLVSLYLSLSHSLSSPRLSEANHSPPNCPSGCFINTFR